MANWYFSTGGKAEGPVDENDVLEALKSERITLVDLVFEEGSAAWLTVGEVPQFREAFHEFKRKQTEEAERKAAAELARLKQEADAKAEALAKEAAKEAAKSAALESQRKASAAATGSGASGGAAGSSGSSDANADRKRAQQAKLQEAIAQTAKIAKSLQPQSIAALSAADEWVILRKSGEQFEQIGPFTREFVLAKLGTGEIEYSQYAWKPGFQRWVRIGNLPEFDRRKPDRDAADLAKIMATVPTPSWEQEAMRTPSPSFDDVQTSVLQFDHPMNQLKKNAAVERPPKEAEGEDLLGSVTSPGFKKIGESDQEAHDFSSPEFQEELTPIPEEFQKKIESARAPSRQVQSTSSQMNADVPPPRSRGSVGESAVDMSSEFSPSRDESASNTNDRPFDEVTQPSFHSLESEVDENTGDFSKYLGTKPLLDEKSGGPPKTISRAPSSSQNSNELKSEGPPPLKKNSNLNSSSSAHDSNASQSSSKTTPPPRIEEDLDATRVASRDSFDAKSEAGTGSVSITGLTGSSVTSPTLVRQQAELLSDEPPLRLQSKVLAEPGGKATPEPKESTSSFVPPAPRGEFESSSPSSTFSKGNDALFEKEELSGLVSLSPAKSPNSTREAKSSEAPAQGSLREALLKSQSNFDDQATVVGTSSMSPPHVSSGVSSNVSSGVPSGKTEPEAPRTSSGMLPGDPQSGVFRLGSRSALAKSSPKASTPSVYDELSDGRTVVAPAPATKAAASEKQERDDLKSTAKVVETKPPVRDESHSRQSSASVSHDSSSADSFGSVTFINSDVQENAPEANSEAVPTKSRGIRKTRREKKVSPVVKFARLFVAGLVLGLLCLYGFHVYSTHQFGLTPHIAGQEDDEVQGPPDVSSGNENSKPEHGADQAGAESNSASAHAGPSSGQSSGQANPQQNAMNAPPPPPPDAALAAPGANVTPPPPPPGFAKAATAAASGQAPTTATAVATTSGGAAASDDDANDADDEDSNTKSVAQTKESKSPLALNAISGVRQVAPQSKASSLDVLPYHLASESPLLLLQTNAPIGERILVKIRGRSGEILKLRSFSKSVRVTRNANEYPGVDLSKLKLPTGSYKVEASIGDLKKTAQVFVGSRDSKFGQEIEHHLKEISYEQQREKKSMFFAAKAFEMLAQNLNENFDKLHSQTGAWRTFLRAWNRQVSAARAPIASMIADRRNYPMAYPDEMHGLAKMVTQLSAEARELDTAVQQKRDVASQSTADLAREFTRVKQEIAMISSRRAP